MMMRSLMPGRWPLWMAAMFIAVLGCQSASGPRPNPVPPGGAAGGGTNSAAQIDHPDAGTRVPAAAVKPATKSHIRTSVPHHSRPVDICPACPKKILIPQPPPANAPPCGPVPKPYDPKHPCTPIHLSAGASGPRGISLGGLLVGGRGGGK